MVPFVRLEKCCKTEKATDANMAHMHCIWVPKATNTHLEYVILTDFSTATVVAKMSLTMTRRTNLMQQL
jgi:hypothetical protein